MESVICTPVVGVVFRGIHCVGWFFNSPSGDEALLWRVSSAIQPVLHFYFLYSLPTGISTC